MAAQAEVIQGFPRSEARPLADPNEVVAVILADGTVRELRGETRRPSRRRAWEDGSVSGAGWILWWQRREFAPAT